MRSLMWLRRGARSKNSTLTMLAVGALSIAGCNGQTNQQQTSQSAIPNATTAVTSPVSINAEMVRVVDHAAHQLWAVEKEGMAPKTDADWENVREHTTQVAAAGALIRLEGTGPSDRDWVQQAEWQKWATAMSSAGMAGFQAVETKNMQALLVANGQLVEACEGCHKRFKPDLPSEGVTHSHLH